MFPMRNRYFSYTDMKVNNSEKIHVCVCEYDKPANITKQCIIIINMEISSIYHTRQLRRSS